METSNYRFLILKLMGFFIVRALQKFITALNFPLIILILKAREDILFNSVSDI